MASDLSLFVDVDSPPRTQTEATQGIQDAFGTPAKPGPAKRGSNFFLDSIPPLVGSVTNTPDVRTPGGFRFHKAHVGSELKQTPLVRKSALETPDSRIWREFDRTEFVARWRSGFEAVPEEEASVPGAEPAATQTTSHAAPLSAAVDWEGLVGESSQDWGGTELGGWVKECAITDGVSTENIWQELEEEAIAFGNQVQRYQKLAKEAEEAERNQWLQSVASEGPVEQEEMSPQQEPHPYEFDNYSSGDTGSILCTPPSIQGDLPEFPQDFPSLSQLDVFEELSFGGDDEIKS